MQNFYIKLRRNLREMVSRIPVLDYYVGNYLVNFDIFIRKKFKLIKIAKQGQITHSGHKLNYSADDLSLIEFLIINNDYDKPTQLAIENILKEGDIFFDLGSHIGFFSLIGANIVGDNGHVYSFEPTPNTFINLKKNIIDNDYNNIVSVENLAVTDRCGKIYIQTFDNSSERNCIIDKLDNIGDKGSIKLIDAVSLDFYTNLNKISKVDLIKMDIEGCEYKAIAGMDAVIKKNKFLKLIFEFNKSVIEDNRSTGMEIFNLLSTYGYSKYTILSRKNISFKFPDDFSILVKMSKRDNVNILAEK
jgi:FkbM family methyltransferase